MNQVVKNSLGYCAKLALQPKWSSSNISHLSLVCGLNHTTPVMSYQSISKRHYVASSQVVAEDKQEDVSANEEANDDEVELGLEEQDDKTGKNAAANSSSNFNPWKHLAKTNSRLYAHVKSVSEEFLEGQVLLNRQALSGMAPTLSQRLHFSTKEAIYRLHTEDPETWTFEALATRYRVRADRVEAVYILQKRQRDAEAKGAVFDGEFEKLVNEACGTSRALPDDLTELHPTAPYKPSYTLVDEELDEDALDKQFKKSGRVGKRRPLPYHEMIDPPETADPGGRRLPFDGGRRKTDVILVDISNKKKASWTGLRTPMVIIHKEGHVETVDWETRRKILAYIKPITFSRTKYHSPLYKRDPPGAPPPPNLDAEDPDHYVNVRNSKEAEDKYVQSLSRTSAFSNFVQKMLAKNAGPNDKVSQSGVSAK